MSTHSKNPDPSLSVDPSVDYYNQNAQAFFADTAHLDMTALYQMFERRLPPHPHILDAGCGSGRDTRYFLSRGYQVTAVDASAEMVKLAAALTGHPILQRTFLELDYVDTFDGIWASASLLHVPRSQITAVLARLSQALKPGGVFYLSFKYGPNESVHHGRLFSDYTEASFSDLLASQPELSLAEILISEDVRPGRAAEKWLNVILKKA